MPTGESIEVDLSLIMPLDKNTNSWYFDFNLKQYLTENPCNIGQVPAQEKGDSKFGFLSYSSLPLPMGGMFQDPQWMLKTADYLHDYTIFPIHNTPMIKFNL